jgi:Zn ribbon nucleic-acid-binding protein
MGKIMSEEHRSAAGAICPACLYIHTPDDLDGQYGEDCFSIECHDCGQAIDFHCHIAFTFISQKAPKIPDNRKAKS